MPLVPDAPQECVATLPWAPPTPLSPARPPAAPEQHPRVKDAG